MTSCSVPDCSKKAVAKGFCKAHWHRNRRYGDPLGGFYEEGTARRWLEAQVGYEGDDCLIWPFVRDRNGYARLNYDGNSRNAHRLMCVLAHGEAPSADHEAAHTCGQGHEGCVNPKHLRWATKSANQRDRLIHGTSSRGQGNGCAILNEDDVRAIRQQLAQGAVQTHLAAEYGVTNHAISAIARRQTWAWLD